jgi:hypothetical protein
MGLPIPIGLHFSDIAVVALFLPLQHLTNASRFTTDTPRCCPIVLLIIS